MNQDGGPRSLRSAMECLVQSKRPFLSQVERQSIRWEGGRCPESKEGEKARKGKPTEIGS